MSGALPILIVGGGIAGMSSAISLTKQGFAVEIVESDPEWRVYGAGITITGPTYRAFAELGLLDGLQEFGFGCVGGTRFCNAAGDVFGEVPLRPLSAHLPPTGGIMRPKLHQILSRRTLASGTNVRLGVTVGGWRDVGSTVAVSFSDGTDAAYQAVIVADGAFSKGRSTLFPDVAEPRYTGQYCWRLMAERPPEIDRAHIFSAGTVYAGLGPTGEKSMYMWLLEPRPVKGRLDPDRHYLHLADVMAPFGGVLGALRDGLNPASIINCRPLDALLVPRPWYKGRIILIGDAAHATTPHLASGAGIAVEDSLVLGALLGERGPVEQAFERFMEVRWERCRDIVESSVAIGEMQLAHAPPQDLAAFISAAEGRLQAEIWPDRPAAAPAFTAAGGA